MISLVVSESSLLLAMEYALVIRVNLACRHNRLCTLSIHFLFILDSEFNKLNFITAVLL